LGHLAKLVHVESTMKEEDHAQAKALKLSCCNNLAQCFLKLEMWSKAIDNCTMALELDPDNAKALFRRAQAHVEGKDHELAVKDLKRLGTTSSPRGTLELQGRCIMWLQIVFSLWPWYSVKR
jgi:tetratricopeptide (TPR) repeat protein